MKIVKKIIFVLVGLLMVIGAMAQPTINQFLNLDVGDKYWVKPAGTEINTSMITHGTHQNWDFSNLPTNAASVASICVTPSSTPYADSLEVQNSNLAIKPYDVVNDTISLYQFLRIGNTNMESLAMGMYHNYDNVSVSYTKWLDPFIGMKVPMTFGDSYTDRQILYLYNIAQVPPILRDTSEITVAVVGYGTVKTPAGTFENALLFKETVQWIWWNNYGGTIYKTQGTDVNYQWRVPGIKLSVLSVCIPDGEVGIATFLWKTEFTSGGIENPNDNGNGNGSGGGGNEPYNPSGIWLNALAGGGDYFSKNNGSISFTMGESVVETLAENQTLTQGFNQPAETPTALWQEKSNEEISVYPNPFITEITIEYPAYKTPVNGTIYSNTGQIIKTFTLDGVCTKLHVPNGKPGMYFIRLNYREGSKSYVVVKK